MERQEPLRFYGGAYAVFAPFVLFLVGVAWLGLSGAPDERGFWPILLTALSLGMILSRERIRFFPVESARAKLPRRSSLPGRPDSVDSTGKKRKRSAKFGSRARIAPPSRGS